MTRRRHPYPLTADDYALLRRLLRDEIYRIRTGISLPRPTPSEATLSHLDQVLVALLRHEMSCHT